jgi:hypothetical protein
MMAPSMRDASGHARTVPRSPSEQDWLIRGAWQPGPASGWRLIVPLLARARGFPWSRPIVAAASVFPAR